MSKSAAKLSVPMWRPLRSAIVAAWLQAHPRAQDWLWEGHPELSFRAMSSESRVLDDKKTAHGQAARMRLVEQCFPDALDVVAGTRLRAAEATIVDVLDAYASLESALRVADGRYEEVGGEVDGVGLVMRMVS
jgi:predicted RNase H-like nuclease